MLTCTTANARVTFIMTMCLFASCGPRSAISTDADAPLDADADATGDADHEPCTPCGCDIPEDMVCVPEGPYLSYSHRFDLVREFYISAFLIDRFEVTNAQLRQCIEAGVYVEGMPSSSTRSDYLVNPIYDDYPAVWRRWYDADIFCRWAGKRLPTSAEWEKATRGGCEVLGESPECELDLDLPEYPWGAEPAPGPCLYANDARSCVGDTGTVGSYPEGASPYGVLDLFGNVIEWVSDWVSPIYFIDAPYRNPQGPTEEDARYMCRSPHPDPCRGLEGWSFGHLADYYAEVTISWSMGASLPDESVGTIGFRCARDVDVHEDGGG